LPINIIKSNKLEELAAALATTFRRPLQETFASEIIVVQSKGMQRWLSQQLAKQQGICANIDFPFPNTFLRHVAAHFLPELPETSAYESSTLAWQIMKIIPDCLAEPEFSVLQNYLQGLRRPLKQLQLSLRIADLYDQYLLFRPEMVLGWEQGKEVHWQAKLWRRLKFKPNDLHRAALGQKMVSLSTGVTLKNIELPERVAIFGISTLPPFHIHIFDALSEYLEVNIFLMNPCREYWFDSSAPLARTQDQSQLSIDFSDQVNPLLQSFGKLGADFFGMLEDEFNPNVVSCFVDSSTHTLLGKTQQEILGRDPDAQEDSRKFLYVADDSIQIHVCHSENREIEILHDQILQLLSVNPDLTPGDILVIAPDIEAYAPMIKGIFEQTFNETIRVPYSIADRSHSEDSEIAEAFLAILDLPNSRLNISQVMKILEFEAIQDRFELKPDDLEPIQNWLKQANIRWGLNAEHRKKQGLPALEQNTWSDGLRRLLLGVALPQNGLELFADQFLPVDAVEGGEVVTLGRFLQFTTVLFHRVDLLKKDRTLKEWALFLHDLTENMFAESVRNEPQLGALRRLFTDLVEIEDLSGHDEPIGLDLAQYFLQSRLTRDMQGFGFLSGGVTFCSMLPMRSIPAKVICLLGMNHSVYPRSQSTLGFDLMAEKPRPGDRARRNDDRYLFLETILSARETLYISYVGRSVRDDSSIPPSVVVTELLNYLDEKSMQSLSKKLIREHKLQAFSPKYFTEDSSLFSYSEDNLKAAAQMQNVREAPPLFFSEPLPEPILEAPGIDLQELYQFFRNPTQYLFNRRLNVWLGESNEPLRDVEDFALAGLERYVISNELLQAGGEEKRAFRQVALLDGKLPHGAVGELEFDLLDEKVAVFWEKLAPFKAGVIMPPLEFEKKIDGFAVKARLVPISEQGLLVYRYAAVRPKDYLLAWLRHLALNFDSSSPYPGETILAGVKDMKDCVPSIFRFRPLDNAKAILSDLLKLFKEGLLRPLPFFPQSSFAYCETVIRQNKKSDDALRKANQMWFGGNPWGSGSRIFAEVADPYFNRCFGRKAEPLNEEFVELAIRVWKPIFDSVEEASK